MATLADIESKTWTLGLAGKGSIAEGLAAIRQCIEVILRTTKGTDPLRPEFGSDVYRYVDSPVLIAVPNIKRAMFEAIGIWEKRVSVTKINHSINFSQIIFDINYVLRDSDLTDNILYAYNDADSNLPVSNMLQAFYPYNPLGFGYTIYMQLNSIAVGPPAPESGFGDVDEMYDWVLSNWGQYGKWYQTIDSFIIYLNPGNYFDSKLEISLLPYYRITQIIDEKIAGQQYNLLFDDGKGTIWEADYPFSTKEQMLTWANTNWQRFGKWSIETVGGDFNSDYSFEFSLYNEEMILLTADFPNGDIIINVKG